MRRLIIPIIIVFAVAGLACDGGTSKIDADNDLIEAVSGDDIPLGGPIGDSDDDGDVEEDADADLSESGDRPEIQKGNKGKGSGGSGDLSVIFAQPDDALVGQEYSSNLISTIYGGTGNYKYQIEGLPEGLSFDESSRKIKGTPAKVGSFNIEATVTDEGGGVATKSTSMRVGEILKLNFVKTDDKGQTTYFNDEVSGDIVIDNGDTLRAEVEGSQTSYSWKIDMAGEVSETSGEKELSIELPVASGEEKTLPVEVEVGDEFGSVNVISRTVIVRPDLCMTDIELKPTGKYAGDKMKGNGVNIEIKGGKPKYKVRNFKHRIVLKMSDGSERVDVDWSSPSALLTAIDRGNSYDIIFFRQSYAWGETTADAEEADGAYIEEIIVEAKMSVTDGCSGADREKDYGPFVVDHIKMLRPSLDSLWVQCDFEDVRNSEEGDSYYAIQMRVNSDWVAEVKYELDECNAGDEHLCEDERDFEQYSKNEAENYEDYTLDDIKEIRILKHKERGVGRNKLDADLQFCRFFVPGKGDKLGWVGIFDDELHGNKLDENEVSGELVCTNDDYRKERNIQDRMLNKPYVWMPEYMLPDEYKAVRSYEDHKWDSKD